MTTSDRLIASLRRDGRPLADPRQLMVWAGFLALYCGFDRFAYFIPPLGSRETAWDLSGGLAMALLLWRGPRWAPLVALADFTSSLITPGGNAPLIETIGSALSIATIYALAAAYLRRARPSARSGLTDLIALTGVAALAALTRAACDYAIAWPWNPAAWRDAIPAVSWDGLSAYVGMLVMAPLALVGLDFKLRPTRRFVIETMAQAVVLCSTMVVVFPIQSVDQFQQFYLLFLPLIWIAVRYGVRGAAIGNAAVQVGLITYFVLDRANAETMFNYDYRLLAVMISTLLLGGAVSERRLIESTLAQRQDQLARVSRLSLVGEMAAALAHELNQPLTASIAFTRAAQRLTEAGGAGASEAMDEAVAQAERAGAIIHSLRRFVGKSRTERKPCDVPALTREAVALAEPFCAEIGARIDLAGGRQTPTVLVDSVQIQQVLLNLIQNAADALAHQPLASKVITISAWTREPGWVQVEVRDNGAGIAPAVVTQLFEPFSSVKPDGMGLGLTISRGIVEAHGGTLWLADNKPGACAFRFTLPQAGARGKAGGRAKAARRP